MIESNKSITICCDFLMTRNKTQRYHGDAANLLI